MPNHDKKSAAYRHTLQYTGYSKPSKLWTFFVKQRAEYLDRMALGQAENKRAMMALYRSTG